MDHGNTSPDAFEKLLTFKRGSVLLKKQPENIARRHGDKGRKRADPVTRNTLRLIVAIDTYIYQQTLAQHHSKIESRFRNTPRIRTKNGVTKGGSPREAQKDRR